MLIPVGRSARIWCASLLIGAAFVVPLAVLDYVDAWPVAIATLPALAVAVTVLGLRKWATRP